MRAGPLDISLRLHDVTDVLNCSQLVALVGYVHEGIIKENFIFCEELKITTKSKDVFRFVEEFFSRHEFDI